MSSIVIGIAGRKRHGKDTVARFIKDWCGENGKTFEQINFADELRWWMKVLNPLIPTPNGGSVRYAELEGMYGYEQIKTEYPEVREFLQKLGTDCVRHYKPEFWADVWHDRVERSTADVIVSSDVRFLEEVTAVQDAFGSILWVERPSIPCADTHASEQLQLADIEKHVEESFVKVAVADILNDGNTQQLRVKVNDLMDEIVFG